ncbi:MFS transporter [Saccharopolyspora rhizosphaerae]|uniref:MFS transporter n=1 Tax=Saccharopolyspora rhizosphaerae TaxID=2492662 RepID=UPI002D78B81C|nr:MFS transporter [Saccharopolyspora rhizosphaerae]
MGRRGGGPGDHRRRRLRHDRGTAGDSAAPRVRLAARHDQRGGLAEPRALRRDRAVRGCRGGPLRHAPDGPHRPAADRHRRRADHADGSALEFVLGWGLLVGTGCGALATTFAALVADRWFAARRGLVAGVLTAATVFGQFALLPVFSLLVDVDWRAATGALVAAALLVAPLAWAVLRDRPADVGVLPYGAAHPEPPPAPAPVGGAVRALPLRSGWFWLLAGTFAICGASTNGIMWTHFTPAAQEHGMPTGVASSLLAVVGVVNVFGTVGSGWLTDRFDPRLLLTCYYALRGVSLALLPGLFGPRVRPGVLAFVVVFGLLDVATVPPTIALCRRLHGADGPIAFGWISLAHQLGAGSLAYLGGLTRDLTGTYSLLWPTTGALCLAAALLALRIPRSPVHPRSRPPRAGHIAVPSPTGRWTSTRAWRTRHAGGTDHHDT